MNMNEKYDFFYTGWNTKTGKFSGTWKDCTMNEFNKLMHEFYIENLQRIEYVERIDEKNNEVKVIFKFD